MNLGGYYLLFLHFLDEGSAVQIEELGGPAFHPVAPFQGLENKAALEFCQGLGKVETVFRKVYTFSIGTKTTGFPKTLGQVLNFHYVALRENYQALHQVFQFTDVARPGIAHQEFHGLGGQAFHRLFFLFAEFLEEVLYQQGDVGEPLPEQGGCGWG